MHVRHVTVMFEVATHVEQLAMELLQREQLFVRGFR
jgi:hypothetical protein